MKSNEEFIAGIYRKAELASQGAPVDNVIAAEFGSKKTKVTPTWMRTAYRVAPVAAAAALLLVIGIGQREKFLPETGDTGVMEISEETADLATEPGIASVGQDEGMSSRVAERQVDAQVVSVEHTAEGTVICYEVEDELLTFTLTAEEAERINPEVLVPGYEHGLWMIEGEEGWQLTGLEYELAEIASMINLRK